MIKRIVSYILSLGILFLLTTMFVTFILKEFLKTENIENMLFANNEELLLKSGGINRFSDYGSEDELKRIYSELVSNYVKYNIGVIKEQPSTDDLKLILNEYCDNYDKVNDDKINRPFIDENISVLEETLQKDLNANDKKIKDILFFLYSNTALVGEIILLLVIISILVLLNREIIKIVTDLAYVFMVNTIGIYALGIAISYSLQDKIRENEVLGNIVKYLKDIFKRVSLISLIMGIILIVIYIGIKIGKKRKFSYN